MLNNTNLILFFGLSLSVLFMLIDYLLWLYFPAIQSLRHIGTISYFSTWILGFISILLFLYGAFNYFVQRSILFWNNFYPLNLRNL